MALALPPSDPMQPASGPARATFYAWLVFALAFGLLISDYMARQVLNAVFPLLKEEWTLSDGQLGLLSGVVALMVGLLTIPLSLVADRWGRVRSLTVMAILWSLATLFCAAAGQFEHMLLGRALVGVGEAAYGSVGIALVISVFPVRMRATLSAAFMAGGVFGQVLGVAIGAQIAGTYGWRMAFIAIGILGLLLGVLFPVIVREARVRAIAGIAAAGANKVGLPPLHTLITGSAIKLAYVGSGLQLFAAAALPAWLPSFFNRYYAMPVDQAGRTTAVFLLISGGGMILCGIASDRLAGGRPDRGILAAIFYSLITAILLVAAFACSPGSIQLIFLALAMFTVAGTTGPAGAMVAKLAPTALHGSAFATLTLANNVFGLAPGPILTGRLADSYGLIGAFRLLPVTCFAASLCFALMYRSYFDGLRVRPDRGS